jgi:hypothetical protein
VVALDQVAPDWVAFDGVDPDLAAAASGGPDPGHGSCRVTVRFPNGRRDVRYADVEHYPARQPERVWAYACLAAAAPRDRDAEAGRVAAELAAARGRRPGRAAGTWTPARVRAAAIMYASREFTPPPRAPAGAWRSVAALAADLGVSPLAVRDAVLQNRLGPALWTGASSGTAAAELLGDRRPESPRPEACAGGCDGTCGPRCPAHCVVVCPTEAQLHAALPAYAARWVAERQCPPWPVGDTVSVLDLAAELGVSRSRARFGAEHGGGLAHDESGRPFTRRSLYAEGPEAGLRRALKKDPELDRLDAAYWMLQCHALKRLPGVRVATLRNHARSVTVPGPGGRKTRAWVHLPPALEEQLRRVALVDVVAAWNLAPRAPGGGVLAGPLRPADCVPRDVLLRGWQARGASVAYQTYMAAVRAGHVQELVAVPTHGGPACAHAIVPPEVRETADRAVVTAWLRGAFTSPAPCG